MLAFINSATILLFLTIHYTAALPQYPTLATTTSGCTSTLISAAPFNLGPTSIAYKNITTSTMTVDCAGCTAVVSKNPFGKGPVAGFTTTVFEDVVGTVTVLACASTSGPGY